MATAMIKQNKTKRSSSHYDIMLGNKAKDNLLTEFILLKQEKNLKDLKGKISFSEGYDYKSMRQ